MKGHIYFFKRSYLDSNCYKMDSKTVGILGGGQLGRMMVEACNRLGIKVAVLDPGI